MTSIVSGIVTESKGAVQWVVLNRPEVGNALDVPTLSKLSEILDECANNETIRCVVIMGEGKVFCSGADVEEWAAAEARGDLETYGWTDKAHALMVKLQALPVPVIAAMNGSAVGAGLDLAMSCDFRYAVERAKFKSGYTSMAYAPDAGGSWHLPRLLGVEAAKEFLFFNQTWRTDKAKATGMITDVFSQDDFMAEVEDRAECLAAAPTFALGKTKALFQVSEQNTLAEQLALETEAGLACGRTADADEALKAAMEKRAPQFTGR